MRHQPDFLNAHNGAAFQDSEVASLYQLRPLYPDEIIEGLAHRLQGTAGRVLEIGCGTGFVTRRLAASAAHIHAVDISAAMMSEARSLPGGDNPRIRWHCAAAETAPFDPPYDLIVSGQAFHWLDWSVMSPRVAALDTPMVLLNVDVKPRWLDELRALVPLFSTISTYEPFDMVAALDAQGTLRCTERTRHGPYEWEVSIDNYIASFHARSSLTRSRMGRPAADEFDAKLRDLLASESDPLRVIFTVEVAVMGQSSP